MNYYETAWNNDWEGQLEELTLINKEKNLALKEVALGKYLEKRVGSIIGYSRNRRLFPKYLLEYCSMAEVKQCRKITQIYLNSNRDYRLASILYDKLDNETLLSVTSGPMLPDKYSYKIISKQNIDLTNWKLAWENEILRNVSASPSQISFDHENSSAANITFRERLDLSLNVSYLIKNNDNFVVKGCDICQLVEDNNYIAIPGSQDLGFQSIQIVSNGDQPILVQLFPNIKGGNL